jgi:hypothetical protein
MHAIPDLGFLWNAAVGEHRSILAVRFNPVDPDGGC